MHPALPLWITLPIVATTIGLPIIAWLAIRRVARRSARALIAPSFVFFALWLAAAYALSTRGFFVNTGAPFPPIGWALVPLLIAYLGYLTLRSARATVDQIPLHRMIGLQLYRALGVVFLAAWILGALPAAFALPTGIGDMAVGLLAPWVAARVKNGAPRARETAILWNVLGITDLVVAVTLGMLTTPGPLHLAALGAPSVGIITVPLVLITLIAVPFSLLLHLIGLHRLTGRAQSATFALSKAA